MAFKNQNLKLYLVVISILLLTLSIIFLSTNMNKQFHLLNRHLEHEIFERPFPLSGWIRPPRSFPSSLYDFLVGELDGQDIKIGLVNMPAEEESDWEDVGGTTMVKFDRVPKDRLWEDYFTEWISEDGIEKAPPCPDLPMPDYKNYNNFNLLVVRMPCGNETQGVGVRDLFRLQVNLVAANLVVNNGDNHGLLVVFISSCGPMWEIFRCEDLLKHEDNFWIYRPDFRRLEQKVLMPVGICQFAAAPIKNGEGKITYDFSKLGNPINNPREAYATVLHSSEAYLCGAIILAQTLVQSNTTKDLVLLADQSITKKSREALKAAGWKIKDIERIRYPRATKGAYNEWNYSKLRLWQLTEYDKVIFIDSDLIVLENIDKFFLYPQLSAASNNKVKFNSGVMLIEPSECMFKMLIKKTYTVKSYNGGDQGFLNEVFTWWHRWPRRLNYLKYYTGKQTERDNKLPESLYAVHYLGIKPWKCSRDYDCNWNSSLHVQFADNLLHWKWWQVLEKLPKDLQVYCNKDVKL